MKTELFIFFSNAYRLNELSRETVKRLGGERLFKRGTGDDLVLYYPGKEPVLLNTDDIDFSAYPTCPLIIIVSDEIRMPESPVDNLSELLKDFVDKADRVYILFHETTLGINQPGMLRLAGDKIAGYRADHHDRDSPYARYLIPLLQAAAPERERLIEQLKGEFGNLGLEKSLRILHSCLTVEGARNVLAAAEAPAPPNGKKNGTDAFPLTPKQLDIIRILSTCMSNFEPEFFEQLARLRDELLGNGNH